MTRDVMDQLFEQCLQWEQQGIEREIVTGNIVTGNIVTGNIVTGNNDADAVYFLHWVKKNHPEQVEHIKAKLEQWGGNASGVNIANIDNLGGK